MCLWGANSPADDATKIVVAEKTPPFKPIVAKIAVPSDPFAEVITTWSADEGTAYRAVRVDGADELDIWAAPGPHWLACIVVIHRYQDQTVLVPDDQDPTNVAKYKPKTLRITLSTSVKEYRQPFLIGPLPPTKNPNTPTSIDPRTPEAPPDGDIAGLYGLAPRVRDKAVAVVQAQYRAKAAGLADAYRVAATELIDGKLGVLNAAKRLKELNAGALSTDAEREAWKPFLDWLGGEMAALAAAGKLLSAKDVVSALAEISLGLSLVK